MSKILSLLLLLAAPAAFSDPVLLYTSNCGATRICVNVQSAISPPSSIALYAAPQYPSVTLIVDGTSYSATSGNDPPHYVSAGTWQSSIAGLVLTAVDGATVTLTADFTGVQLWTGSGRGRRLATFWTLIDGEIDGLTAAPTPLAQLAPVDGGCGGSCHQ